MAFIETNDGTKLFYKDWGTGKPIVFVHGWCINCDSWEYVMNALPQHGVRCVAYDQRGCGRSDQPWTGYDYDTLADDLAALIDQLELSKVTLVGHSMGCGVITRYLTKLGEDRVARVVMLGTTTPLGGKTEDNPDGAERLHLDNMAAAIQKDRARYVSELAPGFLGVEKANDIVSQALIDWGVGLTLQASPRAAVATLRSTFESDQRRELANITVPTLILHGDADQSSPLAVTGEKTAAIVSESQLKVYKGQPHGFYITDAERVNEDVLTFIART